MDFTRRIELDTPYNEAIPRVKDALKDQGFGVLTEIDVRRTLGQARPRHRTPTFPTTLP